MQREASFQTFCFMYVRMPLCGVQKSLPISVRPKQLPITPSILQALYHMWSRHQPSQFISTCLWAIHSCLPFFAFLNSGKFTCQSWAIQTLNAIDVIVALTQHWCTSFFIRTRPMYSMWVLQFHWVDQVL